MHTSLTAQQGTIVHAEVPNKLLEDITVNKKQPADSSNTSKEGDQTLAKCHTEPMKNNSNFWNSKLKEMLTLPMEIARNPNVPGCHKILTFCGAQPGAVFGPGSRVCSPNAFFSRCCLGNKCTEIHRLATDKEAEHILKAVDKFITNPETLKKGPYTNLK